MNFDDVYDILIAYDDLGNINKKEYIRNESNKCLFCLKDSSSTKFDKSSHAISELIGNKRLFSMRECHTCNSLFGETFEDNFGKYVYPFKLVSQIYGKKSSLHYKQGLDKIAINKSTPVKFDKSIEELIKEIQKVYPDFNLETYALFQTVADNPIIKPTPTGFNMTLRRQSYKPEFAYMALLKMAYGIIPSEHLKRFAYGLAYLKAITSPTVSSEEKDKILSATVQKCFLEFVPGINPLPISCAIYKRKSTAEEKYVEYFFIITFCNYSLQIAVPTNEELRSTEEKRLLAKCHSKFSQIEISDFHYQVPEYSCDFTAELIISLSEIPSLRHIFKVE